MESYQRLEKEWAAFNDLPAEGMVACASGSAALLLALESLQIPPASEVIVPDFSMIACARAVSLAGLTPVFVDCGEDLLINPVLLEGDHQWRLYPGQGEGSVTALLAVHTYGRRCDLEALVRWANKWRDMTACEWVSVVEDLAEAHGVRPHPQTDAACWSFYKNKIVRGEEGGAVWFRNPDDAILARWLRSHGFTEEHDFSHVPRGWNHRLSNVHADLILDSLASVEINLRERRRIESWYDAYCPAAWRMPSREAVWVFDVRIPGLTSEQQGHIVRVLNREGIEARHAFKALHAQVEYRNCQRVGGEVAERLSREILYLPVQPGQTTERTAEVAFELIRREIGG